MIGLFLIGAAIATAGLIGISHKVAKKTNPGAIPNTLFVVGLIMMGISACAGLN